MGFEHFLHYWPLQAVAAIVAGVVILLVPRVLNYVIATYLLFFGAIGLLHVAYGQSFRPQTVTVPSLFRAMPWPMPAAMAMTPDKSVGGWVWPPYGPW